MTHQVNVELARTRAAELARRAPRHAFMTPVVRELPRPVGPDALAPWAW